MELREYLFRARKTASQFAKEVGVNANYMREISRGEAIPSAELSTRIEIITGGQVTYAELRKHKG